MPTTRLVVDVETSGGQAALKALGDAAEASGGRIVRSTDTTAKEMAKLEKNFQRLAGSLDPAIRRTQQLTSAQETLTRAEKAGLITQAEHGRLMGSRTTNIAKGLRQLKDFAGQLTGRVSVAAGALIAVNLLSRAFQEFFSIVKFGIEEAAKEEQQLLLMAAHLRSTGEAAGWTLPQLQAFSKQLQETTGQSDDSIQSVEGLLLTFTNLRGGTLAQATKAVLDLNATLGGTQGLKETAIQVGKALNDPVLGATALRRIGISLTAQQADEIKKLVETGEAAKAQGIILAELARETEASADAYRKSFKGSLEAAKNAAGDLTQEVGDEATPGPDVSAQSVRRVHEEARRVDLLQIPWEDIATLLATVAQVSTWPTSETYQSRAKVGRRRTRTSRPIRDMSLRKSEWLTRRTRSLPQISKRLLII